jgi:hypothetical protein
MVGHYLPNKTKTCYIIFFTIFQGTKHTLVILIVAIPAPLQGQGLGAGTWDWTVLRSRLVVKIFEEKVM